jgi:hypothetical protein
MSSSIERKKFLEYWPNIPLTNTTDKEMEVLIATYKKNTGNNSFFKPIKIDYDRL